jgi:phosphonatase-like hydrolase
LPIPRPRIQLAIFDIAGTLIEDHDEVSNAFFTALRSSSINVEREEILEWKGSAKREVIAHFVERQFGRCRNLALIDRTYNEFRYELERSYGGEITPVEGAAETLNKLRGLGMKLATTTGFYREVRDRILQTLGWEKTFDVNVCSDDVAHGRPAPDMILRAMELCGVADLSRVLTIGDTPLDLQSGTRAGCGMVVGVLTGKHTPERLKSEPHTHILASVADVPQLL